MENPKMCPNGLAQLCGWAQSYGLLKCSQHVFSKKKTWTLEMGTYHWDRHIVCFRGIYNVRRQVLFCGVCNHLRGRPKRTKIKNENWDVTGTFENHLRLRKVHQHVGILLGQFMLPPGLLKAGFAQCATRDVQRATHDECLFHKEQLRWAHIIEKVRRFANILLI